VHRHPPLHSCQLFIGRVPQSRTIRPQGSETTVLNLASNRKKEMKEKCMSGNSQKTCTITFRGLGCRSQRLNFHSENSHQVKNYRHRQTKDSTPHFKKHNNHQNHRDIIHIDQIVGNILKSKFCFPQLKVCFFQGGVFQLQQTCMTSNHTVFANTKAASTYL
jgi:hypothetical protein